MYAANIYLVTCDVEMWCKLLHPSHPEASCTHEVPRAQLIAVSFLYILWLFILSRTICMYNVTLFLSQSLQPDASSRACHMVIGAVNHYRIPLLFRLCLL